MSGDVASRFCAAIVDGAFTLAGLDPAATPLVGGKKEAKKDLEDLREELFDLHEKMFAHRERALLLVLQGTDASGKNGTIKHVVTAVNPAGLQVASFDEPTEEELEHHFLWRIEPHVPDPGFLGVFNRSYYEDALVPIADPDNAPGGDVDVPGRLKEINEFEADLNERGVIVLKCLLHISYDEQRRRFVRRLRRHDKRWKFSEKDIDTRRRWDEFQRAYGDVVAATSTDRAPWYVIPSDHKWYRNWAVAELIVSTLRSIDEGYPQPDLDLDTLRGRLEPPG